MKNILKITFVIIGTLIGAGFASGQEIYIFFFSHGVNGLIGTVISSILMGFIIYKTLKIINKYDVKNYKEFLDVIVKSKSNRKYFNIKFIFNLIINMFIIITFFIMIAGFGAYFQQTVGWNVFIGSAILAFLCFLVFLTNVKGLVKANEILVPISIILITIVGIINFTNIDFSNILNGIVDRNTSNWLLNSIIYTSYNSILLIPTLITIRNYIKNKKQIRCIAYISTFVMLALSIMLFFILTNVDVDISTLEMPVVYAVSNFFGILKYIYGVVIVASIFTTSIALGMSFLNNFTKKNYKQVAVIMCITSVIISKFGFSNLVNLLYPIFGYLGIAQIITMIAK